MNKNIGVVAVVLILVLGFVLMGNRGVRAPWVTDSTKETASTGRHVTISLAEQNNSGQNGEVVLSEKGNQTMVIVNVQNAPKNVAQPAHIHTGTCEKPGGVVHPLTSLVNGVSATVVSAPLTDLLRGGLLINVHKSESAAQIYVSCGLLSGN